MKHPLHDHPLRHELSAEVHARPFMHLEAGERVTHLALLTGEAGAVEDRDRVAALCGRFDAPTPPEDANFHLVDLGPFRLRWERHTEFSTYSLLVREPLPRRADGTPERFRQPVIERVPQDWLETLEGEVLVGLHLELEPASDPEPASEQLAEILGEQNFAGSTVAGGAARVWMNLSINDDGFGRAMIRDSSLRPRQAGRLVQRLCEIETYRMTALLAFPLARRYGVELSQIGRRLTEITEAMAGSDGLTSERELLDHLTKLSVEIERIAAATSYRFSAARAYHELVCRRIEELREERIEGLQTLEEFMERRLTPAMRTCEAVAERLETLSTGVARAGQLLRTRVDIELEAQSQGLLQSMDRRAQMQLRLQQTVEGLSVAAITYYGVGLVAYAAKAANAAGLAVPADIAPGLAIPIIAGLVWTGVRRVRRVLGRHMGHEES